MSVYVYSLHTPTIQLRATLQSREHSDSDAYQQLLNQLCVHVTAHVRAVCLVSTDMFQSMLVADSSHSTQLKPELARKHPPISKLKVISKRFKTCAYVHTVNTAPAQSCNPFRWYCTAATIVAALRCSIEMPCLNCTSVSQMY
jgi:hypothetical protein